jgi:hypothetical protein
MYIFGQSHIENVNSQQKMTDTIVFLGNQLSDYVKKFVPSGPETGTKLHQTFYIYRPMLNIGANVYLRAVPY